MTSKFAIIIFSLSKVLCFSLADPLVELPNGLIKGREATTIENNQYYAFQRIPYAQPPVNELRFQAPQPSLNWNDTLDCTYIREQCFQRSGNNNDETEDCLYLNIYTPQLPNNGENVSLPVMLFIHGGGFVDGTGIYFGPDLFINQNVIFVSINYRLGVFGFISTQDEVLPGNNGLKDQKLAIKWTHDNIHLFGGNPEKITVFGQSAGSASTAYQLLNLDSKGLFQAAILESGSFLSPWAFQRNSREFAFKTASILNSSFEDSIDSQALLSFLLTVDAKDLDSAQQQFHNVISSPENLEISQGFDYAPVVEAPNPEAFLTEKMFGLAKAGNMLQMPILIGVTSEENLVFNTDPGNFKNSMTVYDQHLDWIVPNDMGISDQTDREKMGDSIRMLYTNGKPFSENLGDALRYCSDTSFTRSVIKHAEFSSKISDTFLYVFSYDGPLGSFDLKYDGAEFVGHGEETLYLFCSGDNCNDEKYPESDRITRQRLIKLWTDFAKYQNPTPEPSDLLENVTWSPLNPQNNEITYLNINATLEMRKNPKPTYQGWTALYDSLGFSDFDTY